MARPRPVPPPRRARRPVEALEDVGHVLGPDARAVVLDDERGAGPLRPDRDADPAVGRAVADGVVDEDHDQLAEPSRIAGDDGGLRVDDDPDAPVGGGLAHRRGAIGGDVAQVDRHVLERHGPGVGPGEEEQVLDDGGHVPDLVVDVLEGRADARRPARRGGA